MAQKSRYSPRKLGITVDTAHIVIGLAIIIMALFAIFDPDRYKVLFPLIFLLSSALDFITAWFIFLTMQRNQKKKTKGIIYTILGIVLLFLFVVSSISIWFHNY